MIRLVFCIVIGLACWSTESKAQGVYVQDKLVRLQPLTDDHIRYLQALETDSTLDFWTEAAAPDQPVDVHIRHDEYDRYVSEFKQLSLPFTVLVDDLQNIIDEERQQIEREQFTRQLKSRWMGQERADIVGTYVSYNDMVTYMQDQANADPTHVQIVDLGLTVERRMMKGVVLKFNPAATRNIWIDCGIHAREWITPTTCIYHIDQYIKDYNNNDPTIRSLLDYWNVYIIPSLNPDGYEFSRTSGNRLWRKSRNVNSGSTCMGTDLNRNFPWQWMTGGASTSPCSETFGGRASQSEIETRNMVNFLLSKQGTWDMYMSFHSYGQWWFTPYGYTTNYPTDYNKQFALAQSGALAITSVNNRRYTIGSVARLLYIASGSTVDWAYDVLKCRFAYTIELPPTQSESSTGFVLPPALAPGVCRETYMGMKVFLEGVKKEVDGSSSG
jgi:carboxypeptidase A2